MVKKRNQMKDKIKKEISIPLKNNNGMVSSHIKPFSLGTANVEAKLIEKLCLLGMLHIRVFGSGKHLMMGKDFSHIIDKPLVAEIIRLEEECDYMFRLLEKIGKATYLKDDEEHNYDNDIYAHTETFGKWHFHKKKSKRIKSKKRN